jgi:two-component system response regulator NreC
MNASRGRQREVLQLVAEGKGMKEVGFILNLSPRRANYHKYEIRREIGATSDAELVRYAVRNHIVAS